jgi:hypothetical protein
LGKPEGKHNIVIAIHKTTIASKFIDIDISICPQFKKFRKLAQRIAQWIFYLGK